MRRALEANPNFPIDFDFIKKGGHFYSELSDRGKENVDFLIPKPSKKEKKYQPGTAAMWVVPYLQAYLEEYERLFSSLPPAKRKRLPYSKSKPLGALITLSEYQGLLIEFMKHTKQVNFGTWDLPVNGNIMDDNGQKRVIPPGTHHRASNPTEPNTLWKIAYGSEDPTYFSESLARDHARAHFDWDVTFHCHE
jgi:hypothetical protein